jgi:electron transport complex protein RnfE
MVGMCPTMAVTNVLANGVAMGAATTFVLVGSGLFVSLLRKYIAHEVRISTYILIIATFVTLADLLLAASFPDTAEKLYEISEKHASERLAAYRSLAD